MSKIFRIFASQNAKMKGKDMTALIDAPSGKLEAFVKKLRQRKAQQQQELLSQRDLFFAKK